MACHPESHACKRAGRSRSFVYRPPQAKREGSDMELDSEADLTVDLGPPGHAVSAHELC